MRRQPRNEEEPISHLGREGLAGSCERQGRELVRPQGSRFGDLIARRLSLIGGADGQEAVIEFFGPGESVLLPAVLLGLPYLVSARATADGQAILVPASKFREFLAEDPTLAAHCARTLSRHWRALITQIKEIKTQGAAERLAHFLVSQSGKSSGAATLVLPGLKKEVATRLGIKPETLSRSLRKLRDYGVDTEGDTIRIACVERLAALTSTAPKPAAERV